MKSSLILALLFLSTSSQAFSANGPFTPALINGQVVAPSVFGNAVVLLQLSDGACTAEVVGPRAILTAGHCVQETSTHGSFSIGSETYQVTMAYNPKYDPNFDYSKAPTAGNFDIAVGVVDRDVVGVTPMTVGGPAKIGQQLIMAGYGCITTSMTGGNDGQLRSGTTTIASIQGDGMLLTGGSGALACPGDSGGPALSKNADGTYSVLGDISELQTNDKNILLPGTWVEQTNFSTNQAFITNFATQNKITFCGINATCHK